ncbi:methyltransferase domain-containing protein [Streptosporangiaceae bacterium NEAU-GS5]|nr:methyltransferase domain-containing protein [Streptosporangiaceae bacterium NEAU-GS5]
MAHEEIVQRYSELARHALDGEPIVDCEPGEFTDGRFGRAGYLELDGLPAAAIQASLGCGNPVAVADLRPGETVLDLGSGGGIDVLLSARRVGPSGKAFGVDGSPDMLRLARRNAAEAGAGNVEFLHGTIEAIPLPDLSVDVVISNCVINLSDDKAGVLREMFRVLRPCGRIGISDVIAEDGSDPTRRAAVERRVGCAAGVITVSTYRDLLLTAGFVGTSIELTVDHGEGVHSAIIKSRTPRTTGDQRLRF